MDPAFLRPRHVAEKARQLNEVPEAKRRDPRGLIAKDFVVAGGPGVGWPHTARNPPSTGRMAPVM